MSPSARRTISSYVAVRPPLLPMAFSLAGQLFAMTQTCSDPDPYAELDYRADAGELSEEFRKPIRILRSSRTNPPGTVTNLRVGGPRIRI